MKGMMSNTNHQDHALFPVAVSLAMPSLLSYPPTAHHRAVKARCPLRSRIRAEWQSVRACAAVARCDILLTADAVQSAGGAFTFPDRLAVGRLTLDQLPVVRIHVREPHPHFSRIYTPSA